MLASDVTYIVLIPHCELDRERIALCNEDLEDEELVDDFEALRDTNSLRGRCVDCGSSIMKICCHLSRVWRQLDALIDESENISFDLRVVVLEDLGSAAAH